MSFLNDQRITRAMLSLPTWGQWRLECVLDSGTLPTGAVDVDLAGLPLLGTVLRADFDLPERPHVVVVGALGWNTPIPSPLSWNEDPGVRLSTVLAALAAGAGEPIVQPTDFTIGLHYATPASRTGEPSRYREALTEMVRAGNILGWWVGVDGVTRFAARETGDVATRATPLGARGDVGLRIFGVDDPVPFMPGRSVDGVVIGRAVIVETTESLTVQCWAA
jgi:hypothetical protein